MKLDLRRGSRLGIALCLAAGLAVFSGCAGAGVSNAPEAGYPDVPQAAPGEGGAPTSGPDGVHTAPQIARTASISIVVDDVAKTAQDLTDAAATLGGWVTAESLSLPGADGTSYSSSTVEVTVPSDRLDEALTKIAGLGRVTDRQIESEDVTTQVVDVDARVQTMRDSIARLQDLMSKAGSVTEIAQVEAELTQRQADLEALLARQKALSQRVATAPITVTLRTESQAVPEGLNGFLPGLQAGWDAMTASASVAVTVVGVLLPWLVLAAIIVVPIVAVHRHRRRMRLTAEPVPVHAVPSGAGPMPPSMTPGPGVMPPPAASPMPPAAPPTQPPSPG